MIWRVFSKGSGLQQVQSALVGLRLGYFGVTAAVPPAPAQARAAVSKCGAVVKGEPAKQVPGTKELLCVQDWKS